MFEAGIIKVSYITDCIILPSENSGDIRITSASNLLAQTANHNLTLNSGFGLGRSVIRIREENLNFFSGVSEVSVGTEGVDSKEEARALRKVLMTSFNALLSSVDDLIRLSSYFRRQDVEQNKQFSEEIKSLQNQLQDRDLSLKNLIEISNQLCILEGRKAKLLSQLQESTSSIVIDRETGNCGKKHENLERLDYLAKAFPLEGLEVPLNRLIRSNPAPSHHQELYRGRYNETAGQPGFANRSLPTPKAIGWPLELGDSLSIPFHRAGSSKYAPLG